MATYVAAYKGYIADVPQVWFKRCDGEVFHYDEITQASVNPQTNFTEINAGWQLYPVAYLPGQSTMEISMTSGQFNADLFAMANKVNFATDQTYTTFKTETLTPDATTHKVSLATVAKADTVSIRGLTETASTVESGKFKVTSVEATQSVPAHSDIEFYTDETGPIEISYEYTIDTANVIKIDNKSAATGEAVMKWPVYGAGDDCTDNAVKGYVILRMYRCRVTQMPGFDTSYKSAATNAVTFSAMDAKKDDGEIYEIAYVDA